MAACPACSREVQETHQFCQYCGKAIPKASNLKYWGIGTILLVVILFELLFPPPRAWWSDWAGAAQSMVPFAALLVLSVLPRTRKGLVLLLIIGLPVAIAAMIFISNFLIMEKKQYMAEAKADLRGLHAKALTMYAARGTFEVSDLSQLGYERAGNNFRYSIWYSVKGIPVALPLPGGGRYLPGPCDVTAPPASVKVAASVTGVTVAARGNLDSDATCDEWSISEGPQRDPTLKHEIDDVEQ